MTAGGLLGTAGCGGSVTTCRSMISGANSPDPFREGQSKVSHSAGLLLKPFHHSLGLLLTGAELSLGARRGVLWSSKNGGKVSRVRSTSARVTRLGRGDSWQEEPRLLGSELF